MQHSLVWLHIKKDNSNNNITPEAETIHSDILKGEHQCMNVCFVPSTIDVIKSIKNLFSPAGPIVRRYGP